MSVRLAVACADYDRTRPLIDGRVRVAGCDARIACLPHEDMFVRALTSAEFDVTEMSFGRFIASVAHGESAYFGLPVFLSRIFRHSAIYIRTDRGIRQPGDLKGRIFGVRNYANTASVVARGMLEDEYGVTAKDISWRVGDVDEVERSQIGVPKLPPGFDVKAVPPGRLLSEMLAAGDIDGLVDYQPPHCFVAGHRAVAQLFPDHVAAERDYFNRTRIFPIMHLVGVRRSLVEREPWIATSLYDAFSQAKRIATADLWSPGAVKITLPWISEEFVRTVALMGEDFWPYGIAANRAAIDSLVRYSYAQGLSPRRPALEELFAAAALTT